VNNQETMPQQSAAAVDTSIYGNFTTGELNVIRHTIAKDLTDPQFALFMRTAAGWGLNPFLGHIHAMSYAGKMSIQVAVEGYEYKAEENYPEEYLGTEIQLVHENDVFEAERMVSDGVEVVKVTKHTIKMPRGKVVGGYAIARRKGFADFTVIMETDEVEDLAKKDMWKKWFNDMFKKHIKKRAIKGQFRLNINEDDATADRSPIDVTPSYQQQSVVIEGGTAQTSQRPQQNTIQVSENESKTPEQLLAEKRDEVLRKMEQCGMNDWQFENFAMEKLGKLPKEMNVKELIGLSRLLDVELQGARAQKNTGNDQGSLLEGLPDELGF
jgi:recombination protein RecT